MYFQGFAPMFAPKNPNYVQQNLEADNGNRSVLRIVGLWFIDPEVELYDSTGRICGTAKDSNGHMPGKVATGRTLSLRLPAPREGRQRHDRGTARFL